MVNLSKLNYLKISGALSLLTVLVLSFQNCGQSDGNDKESRSCTQASPQVIAARLFVNGLIYNNAPLTLPANQNISFGATYSNAVACGATGDWSYWLLPDGSKVKDYCLTMNNAPAGQYEVNWVNLIESSPCSTDLTELKSRVTFTVQ